MAQPPQYQRTKNFTENFGNETDHSALNTELDSVAGSVNAIRTNIGILQRDDGKLKPDVVTTDSLSTELRNELSADIVSQVSGSVNAAASSAAAANTSATNAGTSATAAANSATAAGTSEANAAASATSATNSATSATNSATSATNSANNASTSANTATTKAGEAATSATTATTKAGEASTSAATATTKAGEASTSATNAATSATTASTAATNAGNSATAAATSESNAATSAAAAAASAMPAVHMVKGLVGNVNATTPLTKYDLRADAVVLRNSAGNTVTRYNSGTLTCDLGLAGSSANGRDQAAAFTADSWIYLYFIWNGTALATLASTTDPASFTGSTLPTGYTHWAFATALRWNASSNIIPCFARGASVDYDLQSNSQGRILSNGVSTSMTSVSYASLVPELASKVRINCVAAVNHTSSLTFTTNVRAGGSTHAGIPAIYVATIAGVLSGQSNHITMPTTASRSIDYAVGFVPATSGGFSMDVLGFTVPNGDA